ncbi:hypothetical protein, partial [Hoeflea sp.]|uniref:hypothetical protein n=1 Tax=Hoeflea sp. TaxID=1940281 RepID=UPI0019932857
MVKIPSFGFSAFLKIVCANEKPQKRAIRERHKPSKSGYDFHRNLRLRVQWLASNSHTVAEVINSLNGITKAPERKSTYAAIKKFIEWKSHHKKELSYCDPITFQSPNGLFQVKFTPDFLTELDGRMTAVHVWNTQEKLSRHLVIAILTTVASNWSDTPDRPDDFAVFSLQDGQFYRWSEHTVEHRKLAQRLML